ncbi:MAG: hypothetical protein AAF594_16235 [Bacteroidota bacterium]
MERPYVLTAVLPQVRAHAPPGAIIAGVLTVPGLDGQPAASVPLVYERLVVGEFASVRPFYVAFCEGEPAEYFSPAAFRRLVRQHRAFVVAERPVPAARPSARTRAQGGFALAPEVAVADA